MKVKRITCILLISFMLLAHSTNIHGISEGNRLVELGLVEANDDLQEFNQLSRGELAKLLCDYMKVNPELISNTVKTYYSDVDPQNAYYLYVHYLFEAGIMVGDGKDLFMPEELVTEEMLATVLLRILGYDPEWGLAVPMFRSMSGALYDSDICHLEKRHVYTYFYRALGIYLNNSTETLANKLGYDDEEYILYGAYLDDDKQLAYQDINGNNIDIEALLKPATGTRYIYEEQQDFNYALIDEDGSLRFGGTHGTINRFDISHSDQGDNINNRQEGYCLVQDNEYIMLNSDLEIIKEGVMPDKDYMRLVEVTEDYAMYFSGSQYYELYDLKGNQLIGNEELNALSTFFLMHSLENKRYICIDCIDATTWNDKLIIYDVVQKEIVVDPILNITSISFQGDYFTYTAFVYSKDQDESQRTLTGATYGLVNIVTGEVNEMVAENIDDPGFSFMGEYIVHRYDDTTEVFDYDLNKVTVFGTDPVSFLNWDYYLIQGPEGEKIVDAKGNVKMEDTVAKYGFDAERQQIFRAFDGTIEYYNQALELVSVKEEVTPGSRYSEIRYVCADGNFVEKTNGIYTLKNKLGDILFEAESGSYLKYNYLLDYVIHVKKGDYTLLDSSGNIINDMEGYPRINFVGSDFIEVYDGEKTLLIDKELNRVGELLEGNVRFSTVWKHTAIFDLDHLY